MRDTFKRVVVDLGSHLHDLLAEAVQQGDYSFHLVPEHLLNDDLPVLKALLESPLSLLLRITFEDFSKLNLSLLFEAGALP
eukprot:CAMPEP_0170510750 /NCGR_PEP_ID=MMETSP0208-20121228/65933_1 /TAXON_ID=197538 /ORGANISM="Strombidium inclinatum, Strain S3" /LENGTH=80 /DNA_ID=CAMNT_0010794237 /DNA_START=7296 /DNA_END=7538 /DNA_ORIENTATION=-